MLKRIIPSLLILAMVMGLISGCVSNNQEDSAIAGELVEQDQTEKFDQEEEPQKPSVENEEKTEDDVVEEKKEENDKEQTPSSDDKDEPTPERDEPISDEPVSGNEDVSEEPEPIDPEAEDSGYIKILSYNLRGLRNGPYVNGERTNALRAEDVAAVIREVDADIVGVQEVEHFRERSGNFEQLPWLAEKCGYEYYYYVLTCAYDDGSSAGHGIMSKYPIKQYQEVVYKEQKGTAASSAEYGRFVLDVDGTEVVFYNTHLLAGDSKNVNSIAAQQFKQVLNAFYKETDPAVMTGDFNLGIKIMQQIVDKSKLISMNGGPDWSDFTDKASIDNIYVRNVDPYFPASRIGLYVGEGMGQKLENAPPSDHDPVWSYFKIT